MTLWIMALAAFVVYGLFFLLPLKLKLYKRHGIISKNDLLRIAKEGDPDAVALKKRTGYGFVLVILLALTYAFKL